jgi:hypothetical protein
MIDVFISYAEEDNSMAMRIANDLKSAKLEVWRYEINGRKAVDFRDDIKEHIDKAQWFCLIDSAHSRASRYVKDECLYAYTLNSFL